MDLRRSHRLRGRPVARGQLKAGRPHPFWISTDVQLYADNYTCIPKSTALPFARSTSL